MAPLAFRALNLGATGSPYRWSDGRLILGYAPRMDANDAELPTQNAEGVDLTLVRWMLALTPAERVEWVESVAQSLQELRELNRER